MGDRTGDAWEIAWELALGRPEAKDLGRVLPALEVGKVKGRVELLLGDRVEELRARTRDARSMGGHGRSMGGHGRSRESMGGHGRSREVTGGSREVDGRAHLHAARVGGDEELARWEDLRIVHVVERRAVHLQLAHLQRCLLYTSPSPRDS